MKIQKHTLIIVLLLSTISCSSNNKIDNGFTEISFNVDENLLSNTPEMIENIFQIKFPADFNKIDDINFQAIKTAIDSDTTSFFQMSLIAVYKSLSGSTSILSKILSNKNVFNEIDSTYYNVARYLQWSHFPTFANPEQFHNFVDNPEQKSVTA